MLENGALTAEDPFLPLSEGRNIVGTAWLIQIALGWISADMGPEGLSLWFTLIVCSILFIYAYVSPANALPAALRKV